MMTKMNKDIRGIILQYASITDSRYQALLESRDVDVSDFAEMLESLNTIEKCGIRNELYGQGLMLETNVGNFCVVSKSKTTEELKVLVESNRDEAISHIKTECYVYAKLNEKMGEYAMEMEPSEGDFYKKGSTVYVVADLSTRHVALFDIKNEVIVEPLSALKKYDKVLDNSEFVKLSKKFERVTEGKKYLNYALNEENKGDPNKNWVAENEIDVNYLADAVNHGLPSDDGDGWDIEVGDEYYTPMSDVYDQDTKLSKNTYTVKNYINIRLGVGNKVLPAESEVVVTLNNGEVSGCDLTVRFLGKKWSKHFNTLPSQKDCRVFGKSHSSQVYDLLEKEIEKSLKGSVKESTQTGSVSTKIDTEFGSGIVGKAFEFEDGIFVVTDELEGIVYMIGPDDELYQMSREDFDAEVVKEVSDEE